VLHTLVHGLERLEYRGYDSAWVAVFWENTCSVLKTIWRVEELSKQVRVHPESQKYIAWIAHTRWATHWWVTQKNCHPHISNDEEFYVVHNWIIENYRKLKTELEIEIVTKRIRGAYALLIARRDNPHHLVWVRLWSPLLFGYTWKEFFFSSDAQAMAWYADKIIYLEDWDILSLEWDKFLILSWWVPMVRNIEDCLWYILL